MLCHKPSLASPCAIDPHRCTSAAHALRASTCPTPTQPMITTMTRTSPRQLRHTITTRRLRRRMTTMRHRRRLMTELRRLTLMTELPDERSARTATGQGRHTTVILTLPCHHGGCVEQVSQHARLGVSGRTKGDDWVRRLKWGVTGSSCRMSAKNGKPWAWLVLVVTVRASGCEAR